MEEETLCAKVHVGVAQEVMLVLPVQKFGIPRGSIPAKLLLLAQCIHFLKRQDHKS